MVDLSLLKEIPSRQTFHSALLTTYSLDFYFLESRLIRSYRSKGIRNIAVLADARMIEDSIYTLGRNIKKSTSLYTLNTVLKNGAFHPKIHVLLGDNAIMIFFGSGNISSGGFGKNNELFTTLYADDENQEQLPLIRQVWAYMQTICSDFRGISSFQLREMEKHCSLLTAEYIDEEGYIPVSKNLDVAFLSSTTEPIWNKVKQLVLPAESVNKITVVSPYYDEQGAVLSELAAYYTKAKIDVLLQPRKSLVPSKIPNIPKVNFYDWSETEAFAKLKKQREPFLHAKLFHFQATDTEFLITGSANATNRAFLHAATANEEAVLLFKGTKQNWLNELGITGYSTKVDLKAQKLAIPIEINTKPSMRFLYKIQNVDLTVNTVKVHLLQHVKEELSLVICDADSIEICNLPLVCVGENECQINIIDRQIVVNALYAMLQDKDGKQVSNKQLVNNEIAIWNNNPSPENRRLQQLLDKISSGSYSEFDLFDYSDVIFSEESEKSQYNMSHSSEHDDENDDTESVSYEDAKNSIRDDSHLSSTENGAALRILDSYLAKIKSDREASAQEDIDDEEEGNILTGNSREEKLIPKQRPLSLSQFDKKQKIIVKFFNKYIDKLTCGPEGEYELTKTDFAGFLICMSHLISISTKPFTFTNTEGEEESDLLLRYKGPLHEITSTSSIAINAIGKLLLHLNRAVGFKKYQHEFDVKQFEELQSLSQGIMLLLLSKLSIKNTFHTKKDKWYMLLLMNMILVFKGKQVDVRKAIDTQLKMFDTLDFDLGDGPDYISSVYEKYYTLSENYREYGITNDLDGLDVVYIERIGLCTIEKSLPKYGPPKSLKISNLGFSFEDDDFTHAGLYNIERKQFLMPSKTAKIQ